MTRVEGPDNGKDKPILSIELKQFKMEEAAPLYPKY
jgi:hypothetical protein